MKKKPCNICERWFWPNPRVGARQRTCNSPKCQRERHRRNCLDWHRRNPNYDREDRLRGRLIRSTAKIRGEEFDPLRRVNEQAARDAVGVETYVFIEEISRLLLEWVRDLVSLQPTVTKEEISRVGPRGPRDEIGETGPSP